MVEVAPDAAKSVWADCASKPENIRPDWANYDPEVIVIAPSISEALSRVVAAEGLRVSLVELTRYEHEGTMFYLVDSVNDEWIRQTPVSGQQEYDWTWFENQVFQGPEELQLAKSVVERLEALFVKQGWRVSVKFLKW